MLKNEIKDNHLEIRRITIHQSKDFNKSVFILSSVVIFFVTAIGAVYPQSSKDMFVIVQNWLTLNTSWIYILAVATIMLFSIWLMMSRVGDIKLGPDHSTPEYNNLSWFAMLFSAGMGIGLLFFGVAEPIMHFSSPPVTGASPVDNAREAMKITFFHWGLHAWAIYAVVAVMLAYYSYRKNLPLLPRSIFYPVLGERVNGSIGNLIDTFCVIGTMFGVATSLGFGVTQLNAGLSYIMGIPQSLMVQVILIAFITLLATTSVVLGLDKGIKRLSNLNMILACLLLMAVLLLGDSVSLMKAFVQNTGAYLSDITFKTFNLYTYEKKESWIGGWTLLYWGWWVSWSPFVGMFIARISKGRTIREFMSGVLFIPTGFTFLWMTVFGNSALAKALNAEGQDLITSVNSNVPVALFKFFEFFPNTQILSIVSILLIVTFFVSSSDSGSLVIDTLSSGGAKEPPLWQRVYWALMEGVVASALLMSGGLDALQTMTIASAFPMIFLILIGVLIFIRSLKADYMLLTTVQTHNNSIQFSKASTSWKERLHAIARHPSYESGQSFLSNTVHSALEELKNELLKMDFDVELDTRTKDAIRLVLKNEGVENFYFGVRLRPFLVPKYVPQEQKTFYRAEVFLLQGGQEYDVFGHSKEQIVADAINHFEKHFQYLHLLNSEQPNETKKT